MTDAIRKHLIRYPKARSTTISYLQKKAETTERLRAEIAAARRRKFFGRILSWIWRRA